jgi:hypothetical protein
MDTIGILAAIAKGLFGKAKWLLLLETSSLRASAHVFSYTCFNLLLYRIFSIALVKQSYHIIT